MTRTIKVIRVLAFIVASVVVMTTCAVAGMSTLVSPEVSARSAAMGSTYVVLAEGASATIWNPAALAVNKTPDVLLAFTSFGDTDVKQTFGAVAAPIGREHFGFAYADTNLSDFAGVGYHERTYTLAYGHELSGGLSGGLSVNRVAVDSALDAKGWNTMLALRYAACNNVRYALRLKDVSSRLAWDDGKADYFHTTFDIGAARDFDGGPKWGKVTAAVAYTELGVSVWRDGFKAGVEGSPLDYLALRAGLAYGHPTAGLGLKLGDGSIDIAWAYRPVLEKAFVVSGSLKF